MITDLNHQFGPNRLRSAIVVALFAVLLAVAAIAGCGSSKNYVEEGNKYFEKGDLGKALEQYEEAIQDNPKYAPAYYNRGVVYSELGLHEQALKDFDAAIQLNPKDDCWPSPSCSWPSAPLRSLGKTGPERLAGVYNDRGFTHGKLGQLDRALLDFGEAIRLNPQYADAYHNRGKTFASLGDGYNRTIQSYTETIHRELQDPSNYRERGWAYLNLGQHERAIEDYTEAIRIDAEHGGAYRNRGYAYANLGQHGQAIWDYTEATRLNSQDADAYHKRGISHDEIGEYSKAIRDYTEATRLDPQIRHGLYTRGADYRNPGQYALAIQDYDNAIRIDPENAVLYHDRGVAYEAMGHLTEAKRDFARAKKLEGL